MTKTIKKDAKTLAHKVSKTEIIDESRLFDPIQVKNHIFWQCVRYVAPTSEKKKWKPFESVGVYCIVCKRTVSYHGKRNSKGIKRHMEKEHQDLLYSYALEHDLCPITYKKKNIDPDEKVKEKPKKSLSPHEEIIEITKKNKSVIREVQMMVRDMKTFFQVLNNAAKYVEKLDELQTKLSKEIDVTGKTFKDQDTGLVLKRSSPYSEVIEDDKQIQVTMEIPGVKSKDLDISFKKGGSILVVTGKRTIRKKAADGNITTSESKFQKHIEMSTHIVANKITANLAEGVLVITVPKHPLCFLEKISDLTVPKIKLGNVDEEVNDNDSSNEAMSTNEEFVEENPPETLYTEDFVI